MGHEALHHLGLAIKSSQICDSPSWPTKSFSCSAQWPAKEDSTDIWVLEYELNFTRIWREELNFSNERPKQENSPLPFCGTKFKLRITIYPMNVIWIIKKEDKRFAEIWTWRGQQIVDKVEVHKIGTEMHPEFGRKSRSWVEQQIAAQLRFFPSLQWSKIEVRKICTEKAPRIWSGGKNGRWVEQQIAAQLRFFPFLQWSKWLEISWNF